MFKKTLSWVNVSVIIVSKKVHGYVHMYVYVKNENMTKHCHSCHLWVKLQAIFSFLSTFPCFEKWECTNLNTEKQVVFQRGHLIILNVSCFSLAFCTDNLRGYIFYIKCQLK